MKLNENYNQQEFIDWIGEFLPEFSGDLRKVDVPNGLSGVKSINTIGESALGVRVFVIETEKDPSGRKVGLAKESFNLIKNYGTPNALIAYYSKASSKWRLSLLTSTPEWSQGKIITKLSNPKRQSYVLGPQSKVNTPIRFLLKKETATDINDLKSRFSLEVVNKEFYKEISESFIKLIGGILGTGKNQRKYESILKLPFVADHSQTSIEFAVRLIGRIIFCWFLREKKSSDGTSLMPKELVSLEALTENSDYYHQILEPIFFEVLNQQVKARKDPFYDKPYSLIPYLNGGLFSPHDDDFYKRNNGDFQSQFHNTLVIPDEWFIELFETLETYNFTIDENTSFDEELSIDPEMLGRIFENLLAEINPETGESARKSTGSYYTPRVIVDYMVDESLLLYLKQQTEIEESKLRAIISYDLSDDSQYPLNELEKKKAIDALEKIKILDPACGSGAFPIGALQKMVFILQQIDPDGQLWFKKQIQHTSPEIRRVLEREFTHKNFDYIRKLGVIRENIYGIDIQPIATEISRLRCFLTLVVDERIDDSLENRGIEPLPNLDFKFVTANSLIGLPSTGKEVQFGLFEDSEGISELKEIRDMFFNASGSEREMLKLKFVQSQNKMFQRLISEGRRGHADLTTMLTSWDPFNHKSSSWFDPEWMFGIKRGFDIVIANPPYGIVFDKTFKDYLVKSHPSFKRNNDIYVAFYSRGIQLVRPTGLLTFISPNTFLNGDYFDKLREELLSITNLENITDYKNLNIFADPTVFVCVFICRKLDQKVNSQSYTHRIADGSVDKYKSAIVELGQTNNKFKPINALLEKALLSKDSDIIDNLFFVKDVGFNYWTVGKGKKRDGDSIGDRILYSGVQLNSDDIPFLKGRDVERYSIEKPTNYLRHNYLDLLRENDVFRYSQNFLEISPKIIYRQTSNKIVATIDKLSMCLDKTVHMIVSKPANTKLDLRYLLALLNSSLFNYFYNYISQETDGRTFSQVKTTYIKQLPIKIIDRESQQIFINEVENIFSFTNSLVNKKDDSVSNPTRSIEYKIDQMVYELYGLTEEEIKIIEVKNV